MVASGTTGLVGVVCDDRPRMRAAVEALMERCGFAVASSTGDVRGLFDAVAASRPDVAVLALAACGTRGLSVVGALSTVDRDCPIVVLSSFESLRHDAAAQGARALVDEDDLRALERVLLGVRRERPRRAVHLGARTSAAPSPAGVGGAASVGGGAVIGTVTTNPSS